MYNRPDRSKWRISDRDREDRAEFRAVGVIKWKPHLTRQTLRGLFLFHYSVFCL